MSRNSVDWNTSCDDLHKKTHPSTILPDCAISSASLSLAKCCVHLPRSSGWCRDIVFVPSFNFAIPFRRCMCCNLYHIQCFSRCNKKFIEKITTSLVFMPATTTAVVISFPLHLPSCIFCTFLCHTVTCHE